MYIFKKILFFSVCVNLTIQLHAMTTQPVLMDPNQQTVRILPVLPVVPTTPAQTDSASYDIYNELLMGKYASDFPNINIQDSTGKTALMYAAINGNFLVTKMLVEYGAALDTEDNYGKTALMYAVAPYGYWMPKQQEYAKIIELLLLYGANVLQTDKKGNSVINTAVRTHGQNSPVVKLLERYGAYFDPYMYPLTTPQQSQPYLLGSQGVIY